ncbi:MAG: hypothetical protein ACOCVF_01590 [bacterium]
MYVESVPIEVYADFGEYFYPTNDEDTYTKFKIFVLRSDISKNNDYKQSLMSVYNYKYRYELHIQSQSKLEGQLVDTYIHNIRIFINEFEISKEQFPEGFWVIVTPKGRAVYLYEGNDEILKFGLKWNGAIFYKKELIDGRK